MAINMELKKIFKIATGVAVAATVVGVGSCSMKTVQETERGIDYRFGKMQTAEVTQLRKPGFSFKLPWTSVTKIRIDLQQETYADVHTYTKDNQIIKATLAVMFRVPEGNLVTIYKNNPDWQSKLQTTVFDAAKGALGQIEAQNVALNRESIMQKVTKETQEKVSSLLGIEVVDVKMPNFDFTDDFERSVSEAAKAKAVLNQKQTELEQQRVEAEKTVVDAKAQADRQKALADASAYETKVSMEAKANGLLLVATAESQGFEKMKTAVGVENMQTYLLTKAWNGQMPWVSGTGTTPVLDMRGLVPSLLNAPATAPAPKP
jgi:regulator of protease activity HflC (stomatin/prohibitin superfamily)